ncbi:MAG: hypothetical protein J7M26_05775, partial [Armatimonadetes bacterium]|nr:hypothetical protein [Armatimonadota bacterium]
IGLVCCAHRPQSPPLVKGRGKVRNTIRHGAIRRVAKGKHQGPQYDSAGARWRMVKGKPNRAVDDLAEE